MLGVALQRVHGMSGFAEDALECGRAIVPSLDIVVPRGWASEHPRPISIGPWDFGCSNGLAGFAQSEHCHNLTELAAVDARGRVVDNALRDWNDICGEPATATYERVLRCVSTEAASLTWTVETARKQRLFCTLLGSCGLQQVTAMCRGLVSPASRFLKETCSDAGLKLRKRSCFKQWSADADTLESTYAALTHVNDTRSLQVRRVLKKRQGAKERITLLTVMKDALVDSPDDWVWWTQSIADAADHLDVFRELDEYHESVGAPFNASLTDSEIRRLTDIYAIM